jgi:hypothetical protein
MLIVNEVGKNFERMKQKRVPFVACVSVYFVTGLRLVLAVFLVPAALESARASRQRS